MCRVLSRALYGDRRLPRLEPAVVVRRVLRESRGGERPRVWRVGAALLHGAPLTKEAKSSTIAHVAIAAGRTHALGLVAAARSVVDASSEPKNLRLYLATDVGEGSRARSVLAQSLKCALPVIKVVF